MGDKTNKLSIKQTPVESLIPYARNARTHSDAQVAQIAGSIREFGFNVPVLVDGEGGIIAGHGRVLAARQLGLKTVPTIALGHLTENQKRAYILADNKITLNAEWDMDLLGAELDALKIEDFDLSLTGFNDMEVGSLVGLGKLQINIESQPPPRLDETKSGWVTCPECSHEFKT